MSTDLFTMPGILLYQCLVLSSRNDETVKGWKAGSSVAYCEPCFQEVMEGHEKVDCNDLNETGKNRLNRDLQKQEEGENMASDPSLSLSPYIKI